MHSLCSTDWPALPGEWLAGDPLAVHNTMFTLVQRRSTEDRWDV
jgi:hypothetical protein